MLNPSEARAVAEQFGVSAGQVARDHLISHLLAAISTHAADAVTFFGGTPLARTLLPGNRLSEDIDLIARDTRRDVATLLDDALPRALRREFPGSTWGPALTDVTGPAPGVFRTPDGLTVRVQLLSPIGYPPLPTAFTELAQRYTDAPPATLRVPTRCPPHQRSPHRNHGLDSPSIADEAHIPFGGPKNENLGHIQPLLRAMPPFDKLPIATNYRPFTGTGSTSGGKPEWVTKGTDVGDTAGIWEMDESDGQWKSYAIFDSETTERNLVSK